MKEYASPKIEFIGFGSERLSTFSSDTCNCYAEHWNYAENYEFTPGGCSLTSGDYSEVADANGGF